MQLNSSKAALNPHRATTTELGLGIGTVAVPAPGRRNVVQELPTASATIVEFVDADILLYRPSAAKFPDGGDILSWEGVCEKVDRSQEEGGQDGCLRDLC